MTRNEGQVSEPENSNEGLKLDWSDDLQDGMVRQLTEAVEDLISIEDLPVSIKKKNTRTSYSGTILIR